MPLLPKTRQNRGGGVTIAVRDDISNKTKVIDDLENQDQEIIWIEVQIMNNKKIMLEHTMEQEKWPVEIVKREFSQLKTQMQKLSNNGPIILTRDFNAKLKADKGTKKQAQSRNRKLLEEMLSTTNLMSVFTDSDTGTWTRVNLKKKKKTSERSAIDYIII